MASDVVTVTVSVTVSSPSVTSLVLKHGISATAIALLVYGIRSGHIRDLRRRLFTILATRFTSDSIKAAIGRYKQPLFASLQSIESADPGLRTSGPGVLRILEIGVGDGANLKYYPNGCRLTSVEPNPYFESYFHENGHNFPHISIERFIHASAEEMTDVESDSIDVVVSTHVLCSVADISRCMKEVDRVLVPGGQFFFLEHISFDWDKNPAAAFCQTVCEPFWSLVSDGCKLRRDPRTLIRDHFTILQEGSGTDRWHLPIDEAACDWHCQKGSRHLICWNRTGVQQSEVGVSLIVTRKRKLPIIKADPA